LILGLRLELRYSKPEILRLYAAQAPFGSNVVGLEAASWRYYGRPPNQLSWGESAALAVLPNAPALIYPGKNHDLLMVKRNRLLDKLYQNEVIDSLSCELAKLEPLPSKPAPLPQITPHLLDRAMLEGKRGQRVSTSIRSDLQYKANRVVEKYHNRYVNNEVYNAAMLVVDVRTKEVLAYVGNTPSEFEETSRHVDMITAKRSSGSIMKPFLYAWMVGDGAMLPKSLVADVPTQISGYSPKNFDEKFDGAVPADNALARSLNVPAIRLLQDYGLEKFHSKITHSCINTINKPANHYGLSIILGGAEVKLWEVVQLYAGMSSTITHFNTNSSRYSTTAYGSLNYVSDLSGEDEPALSDHDLFGAGPVWATFEALKAMDRPIEGTNWSRYATSKTIAWKTGTSFGHKDAWAVGVTPEYVVGVWVGNADGEGRPGMTGARYAAPLMFDMYKLLPKTGWWQIPYDDMVEIPVCVQSGYKASDNCTDIDTVFVPVNGQKTTPCPYHKQVHLDKTGSFRVNSRCYNVHEMKHEPRFVLPPVMEWYYKRNNPFYRPLPPYLSSCSSEENSNMDIIYPERRASIFIPRDFEGEYQQAVFEAVHRIPETTLFWYIDEEPIAETTYSHRVGVSVDEGEHLLTIVSEHGEEMVRQFKIVSK
ncbi:MAG: penicillin-binding protein 1C, partial [Mariniphaga sp.]